MQNKEQNSYDNKVKTDTGNLIRNPNLTPLNYILIILQSLVILILVYKYFYNFNGQNEAGNLKKIKCHILWFWDTNGIYQHKNGLECFLKENKIDTMMIAEIHLTSARLVVIYFLLQKMLWNGLVVERELCSNSK